MAGIENVGFIQEPNLSFHNGGQCVDQKTGLSLFGPYSSSGPVPSPSSISIGIIGSGKTIDLTRVLLDKLGYIIRPNQSGLNIPSFPGFSTESVWRCGLTINRGLTDVISNSELSKLKSLESHSERITYVTEILSNKLHNLGEREPKPNVVIIAMPPEVDDLCIQSWDRFGKPLRMKRKYSGKTFSTARQTALGEFTSIGEVKESIAEEIHHSSLYRTIKIIGMKLDLPTQVLQHNTLMGNNVEDLCTIAWNLSTGLYYKAGGQPWRLTNSSHGVCFVGVSFYQAKDDNDIRTSLAQIFSHTGEGIVLRGGKADKTHPDRKPHLDKKAAKKLLDKAISAYQRQEGIKPSRVVIYKSSSFTDDEEEGFNSSLSDIPYSDMLTLDKSYLRLLRVGTHPVLRGTFAKTTDNRVHLYTRGYVPYQRMYWGGSTPRPITIMQHIGDTPKRDLCEEILGLSKMNWNSSAFSIDLPITLFFSRRVGNILSEAEHVTVPKTRYLYYM